MKISKSIFYLIGIFLLQWGVMLILPYFFFKYIAVYPVSPLNIYVDQGIKASAAFILVGLWLLEWMWLGMFLYKYIKRNGSGS